MIDPINSVSITDHQIFKGKSLSKSLSNEELCEIIDSDLAAYESRFSTLLEKVNANIKYYVGEQVDRSKLTAGEAEVFVNRILVAIETMASIVTSVTPLPWVIVTPKTKRARDLENKLERHLRDAWEYEVNMQQKMERLFRKHALSRVGFIKVFWNKAKDCFDAKLVDLKDLRFDLDAQSIDDTKFICEFPILTIEELMVKFPDKKNKKYLEDLSLKFGGGMRSKIRYQEYWGVKINEKGEKEVYVIYKHDKHIFDIEENPYWTKGENHFRFQRIPYIALNSMSLGTSIVDDTSAVENAISIQDLINKRKRQIDKNAWLANGIMVTHANAMSKEEFAKINGKTAKVYLSGDVEDIGGAFGKITGRSLERGVYEDMYDSKNEIDNIFGTHETTRGSTQRELSGKSIAMLRDADYGRQDLTGRSYEQVAEEFYNWAVQMMYVKYKGERPILSSNEDYLPEDEMKRGRGLVAKDSRDDVISKDDFKGLKVKVIVKRGSTRPKDPESMREMAIMLRQTGVLNPLTFFEMVGVDNPRREARREFMWQQDPSLLFPEVRGDDAVDPDAVIHIKDINNGLPAVDSIFENEDIERYIKHLNTHNLYLQEAEIEEDLVPYSELPAELKVAHREHIEQEKLVLQQLAQKMEQEAMQQQAMMGGQMPGAMPGQMPGEMPQEGMGGLTGLL